MAPHLPLQTQPRELSSRSRSRPRRFEGTTAEDSTKITITRRRGGAATSFKSEAAAAASTAVAVAEPSSIVSPTVGVAGITGFARGSRPSPPTRHHASLSSSLSSHRTTAGRTSASVTLSSSKSRTKTRTCPSSRLNSLKDKSITTVAAATLHHTDDDAAVNRKVDGKRKSKGNGRTKTENSDANNDDDDDDDDDVSMVDLTANSSDDDESQNKKMPAKWKCPRCTLLNANSASVCYACDYNPIEDDDNTWKCPSCTLINSKTLSECEACGKECIPTVVDPDTATATATATAIITTATAAAATTASPTSSTTTKKKRTSSSISSGKKSTKRIKRESDINKEKITMNDDDDDEDNDVVVSGVVESRTTNRRDRRRRSSAAATSVSARARARATATASSSTVRPGVNSDGEDDDDDVVLEGVINETKLPHSREDCTENNFAIIDTASYNKQIFKGTLGTISSSKIQNKQCCELCYCYVCDIPAKDCKKWSKETVQYKTPTFNHCCARANIEPWKSMRGKQKAEAEAIVTAIAATAARTGGGGSIGGIGVGVATLQRARPQTAPFGFHFMNKCTRYPRINPKSSHHTQQCCPKCYCYVCYKHGSDCQKRNTHAKADPTSLRWRLQREINDNRNEISRLPTFMENGPFQPDDSQAVQDSRIDKSLIQCQHCKWFTRSRWSDKLTSLQNCMEERVNSISSKDWCRNCGLVASVVDIEKNQADPVPNEVSNSNGSNDNDTIMMGDVKPSPKTAANLSTPPFLLGTKEIPFTIKAHDPRRMKKYKKNWKDHAKGNGWVYNSAKQKEEVFLHRIGKKPRLENLLKCIAAVSPSHIPTDAPKEDNKNFMHYERTHGTAATIDDTDAIIIKDEHQLQLLNLLELLDPKEGIPKLEASWNTMNSSGMITLQLFLPKTAFVGARPFTADCGIDLHALLQPAILSIWFGITYSAGELCGSLKLSSAPKVTYQGYSHGEIDKGTLKVRSKSHEIKINAELLKNSERKLKGGLKQIKKDITDASLQQPHSLVPSYNGRQRFLYHGGGVSTDTSLSKNLTRYFRENFPYCVNPQKDEALLSIHHGNIISGHRDHRYDKNDACILDALIGVKEAVVARSGLAKDTSHARSYKSTKLSTQDRVAQTIVCLESLGHDAEDHVEGLEVELLDFQKQALKWAIERETLPGGIQSFFWPKVSDDPPLYYNPILRRFRYDAPKLVRGGFLAQEMGLGKTIISLALILKNPPPNYPPSGSKIDLLETVNPSTVEGTAAAAATDGDNNANEVRWDLDLYKNTSKIEKKRGSILCGGTLVICPVSLVGQWIEEARQKLADPGLIYPYHGQGRNRDPHILSKNSIVVTTYNVLASDAFYHSAKGGKNYCPPLEMIRWWRVICDEGHCLKEIATNLAKATFQIVSDHRWIVTGTPMNTKIFDIKNQMRFLGIENVTQMFGACGGSGTNRNRGSSQSVVPSHIMYMLKPIVLRHAQNQKYSNTETTLMSLPPKTESIVEIKFNDAENEEFEVIEKKAQKFYLDFRANHLSDMSKHFLKVSSALSPLRVACSGGKYPLEGEKKDIDKDDDDTDMEDDDVQKKKKVLSAKLYSEFAFTSKFRVLLEKLETIRDTDASSKSLVFSQYNSTLNYLQTELPKHGFQFRTLQGSMSMKQRAKALKDFQNDPPTTVFLLSMRSGAVGINLTQANRIFLMEPSFNPALEAQAIGRVYRLGQKREVNIVRLVISDSFESRMMKFLHNKYHDNDHSKKNAPPPTTSSFDDDGDGDGDGDHDDDDDSNSKSRAEKKEQDSDDEIGLVGNIFLERAQVMTKEFDLLFGVSSIVKQQAENDPNVAPDHIGSKATPDHVGSQNYV